MLMHFPPSIKLEVCPQLPLLISARSPPSTYLKLSAEREKQSAQWQTLVGTQENKSSWRISWNDVFLFQFEEDMVDICFILLAQGERSQRETDPAQRKNPVHVCRAVAAMVRRAESSSDLSRGHLLNPRWGQTTDQRGSLFQATPPAHLQPVLILPQQTSSAAGGS